MNDIKYKAIVFVEGNNLQEGFFYYNVTLPDAIQKFNTKTKLVLSDKGFHEMTEPFKPNHLNLKVTISLYP